MNDFKSITFDSQTTWREGDNPPPTHQAVTPEYEGYFVQMNQSTFWGLESHIIFDCSQQTYPTVHPEYAGSFVDHLGSDGVHNKIIFQMDQKRPWDLDINEMFGNPPGPAPAPDETSPEVLPPFWNLNSTALPDKHNHDQCKDNLDINTSSTKMRAPYIIHLN